MDSFRECFSALICPSIHTNHSSVLNLRYNCTGKVLVPGHTVQNQEYGTCTGTDNTMLREYSVPF
jgi:hypothetical protein